MISVILPVCHESSAVFRRAVDSILNQTINDIECIIVIDDPCNTAVLEASEQYTRQDGRIVLIRNKTNMGQPYSMNEAIRAAHGEYIARMDADDISLPDRFEVQRAYLEKYHLDLIGGGMRVINADEQPVYEIQRIPRTMKYVNRCLRVADCVPHPTWFGRRSLFLAIDGYRELPVAEDYDFLVRAALTGRYRISNMNRVVLEYRRQEGRNSEKLLKQYLYTCYISREFRKGKIPDMNSMQAYVSERVSQRKTARYDAADRCFYRMLGNIEKKDYLSAVASALATVASRSAAYLDRAIRFAYLSLIAKKTENMQETHLREQ